MVRLAQAKRMRKAPTAQERRLCKLLRDRRLGGMKFRRQAPLGRYIVDFVAFEHRLVVEADGPFHFDDSQRDAWLIGQGFRVLRFQNRAIAEDTDRVLLAILEIAEAQPHLLSRGGRR